jgi:hypothetical protein
MIIIKIIIAITVSYVVIRLFSNLFGGLFDVISPSSLGDNYTEKKEKKSIFRKIFKKKW